jgi:hypothetical protein
MRTALITVIFILLGSSTNPLASPLSTSAKVYRSQYSELKSKILSLLDRAQDSRSTIYPLREEQLTLLKLVHRLEEQVMTDNAEQSSQGQTSDKGLLLVAQACNALDFVLSATSNYLDSRDPLFVRLAGQGVALADSTEQSF